MSGPRYVLAGVTAAGKTAVSLPLAEALGAEIVSVDSRQVFRGLEIGSAAPTAAERARVPHHLVGELDPTSPMNAGDYGRLCARSVDAIRRRGCEALLVGGSGLYLQAALGGLDAGLPRDEELRVRLRQRLETEGTEALHRDLATRDPAAAATIGPRDGQRITRALEILELTGRPASLLRTRGRTMGPGVRMVVLDRDREDLEERIRRRVAAMVAAGLEDEVRALLDRGSIPGVRF